jgi:uncharacterized protein (TIGR02246 family)
MKYYLIFTIALGFAIFGAACANSRNAGEATEHDVLSVDDERFAARARRDIDSLSRIYADDYVLVTAEGTVRSKADQINEVTTDQLKFQPPEIIERTVTVSGEFGLVTSHERASIIRNGQEIGGELRMSRAYVRRDGRWQLIYTQATHVVPSGP